eukprot:314060_1
MSQAQASTVDDLLREHMNVKRAMQQTHNEMRNMHSQIKQLALESNTQQDSTSGGNGDDKPVIINNNTNDKPSYAKDSNSNDEKYSNSDDDDEGGDSDEDIFDAASPISDKEIQIFHDEIVQQMKNLKFKNLSHALKAKKLCSILVKVTERSRKMQDLVQADTIVAGNYNKMIIANKNCKTLSNLVGQKTGNNQYTKGKIVECNFDALIGKYYCGEFEQATSMRLSNYRFVPTSWGTNDSIARDAVFDMAEEGANSFVFIVIDSSFQNYITFDEKLKLGQIEYKYVGHLREAFDVAILNDTFTLSHTGANEMGLFAVDRLEKIYLLLLTSKCSKKIIDIVYQTLNGLMRNKLTYHGSGAKFDYKMVMNRGTMTLRQILVWCEVTGNVYGRGYRCEHVNRCINQWENSPFKSQVLSWKVNTYLEYKKGKTKTETMKNMGYSYMQYKVDKFEVLWKEKWEKLDWMPVARVVAEELNKVVDLSYNIKTRNKKITGGHLQAKLYGEFMSRKGYTQETNGKITSG